ncbi:hypothetical protein [Serratia sp. BIGb0163]|uniref:hypothetical protein n=1 Tax=Serratia sp. BIGb0163 TaxID=2940613 RepID=UPI00216774C7|nr:hypothetical protein [Serratia sp. BIGb0163]MCS4265945.1 hypothetical protein [Serratia sp. BIGb0163]
MTEVLTYEALKAERDAQQKRADALAVRNEQLMSFVIEGFNIAGQGGSWCGGDIQELGEKLGLFARETYQPVLHGYVCGHEPGEGSVYVITKSATDAALSAIEARGVDKLIERKLKQLANMHPDTHAFGATAMSLRAQINELQAFAIELREAK